MPPFSRESANAPQLVLAGTGGGPPPNGPPQATDDSYTTPQGAALSLAAPGVLGNDSDPDGDPVTAAKLTDPAGGSVSLNADGSFTYTPNPGFSGADSFNYRRATDVLRATRR